jgi:DNA-binding CsgD family transcriptional regulator
MSGAERGSDGVTSDFPRPARAPSTWALAWPVAAFVVLGTFLGGDLVADLRNGVSSTHLVLEIAAVSVALFGIVGTASQLRRALGHAADLEHDLEGTRVQLERSRSEAEALLRRIGKAIDGHFESWELTAAEREIALLVLKGLSYKEVASARGTTERTVRHQALGIYRKAGVAGRAEMAAFFLQDMLDPGGSPGERRSAGAARDAGARAAPPVTPAPVPVLRRRATAP